MILTLPTAFLELEMRPLQLHGRARPAPLSSVLALSTTSGNAEWYGAIEPVATTGLSDATRDAISHQRQRHTGGGAVCIIRRFLLLHLVYVFALLE
jgi:hypothetical protein